MVVDEVSIPYLIFLRHRGVRVRYWDGSCVVYACSPKGGVVRQRLEAFAEGYAVKPTASESRLTPAQIVARCESVLGRAYDAASWNCDHFVAFAFGRKVESPQLQGVVFGLCVALMVARFARYS